jgi:threonine dehydrogenase-like Zn-dependent dehydrogenase
MISYEIVEHGKPLQKAVRETPKPQGTEVLVRVTRSGVCHSDVHIWEGYFELGGGKRFYVKERGCVPPFIMGHEPFGVVEARGLSLDRLRQVRGVPGGPGQLLPCRQALSRRGPARCVRDALAGAAPEIPGRRRRTG